MNGQVPGLSRSTAGGAPTSVVEPMAVIDIGTTAIRMAIAQAEDKGTPRPLETLQQSVSLGKDTFTTGCIEKDTIEKCVQCLKGFCRVLREYDIPLDRSHVQALATSAVREAENREAFADRIYIATGLEIETIDEAEVNRFTYLSVQPFIRKPPFSAGADILLVDVGGGSTELLSLHKQQVCFSRGYRLGSLRLRQTLEEYRAPAVALRELMENEIRLVIAQIREGIGEPGNVELLAIAGDTRFAASQLLPEWERTEVATLDVNELAQFTDSILEHSVDELVRKYHLTYPDAEALGPALLIYVRLAQNLKLDQIFVSYTSMRNGVLAEMAAHYAWSEEFAEQIVSSALTLGEKYRFDRAHAEYIAALCKQLFRALRTEHHMSARYELLLTIAALLHEIGLFVSNRSHHKHSMYLIANCDLFGLGAKDLLLAAMVARYHRRSLPKPTHEGYASLDRDARVVVQKLAAILRISDALDQGHGQRIREVEVSVKDRRLIIDVRSNVTDLTLEQLALAQRSEMFEQVYGMSVVIRKARPS